MEELRCSISENHAAGKGLIPWLIFPISPIERRNDLFYVLEKNTRYGMLNLTEPNKVQVFDLPDHMVPGHCCVGVYGTWMLMCYDNHTIFLLNPFTGKRIDLPWQNICIPKVWQFVVSEHMIVMVIYGDKKKLAYCRPDHERWTWIKYDGDGDHYVSLVYLEEHFLALDERKGVLLMNYDGWDIKTTRLKFPEGNPKERFYRDLDREKMKSLVCWSEKLLMVEWQLCNDDKTEIWGVSELDTSLGEWRTVKDFGDYALFVAKNYTCALPASEGHCKKKCVYYADHWKKEDVVFHEIIVNDVSDDTTRHLCYGRGLIDIGTQFFAGSGAWIVPSLS